MKFYTSPDFNNLPLTNVSTYDQDSINALFSDLATPEELEKFRGLIVDSIVSQYFVYSSNKTMEEINNAKSECNTFATDLFAKVSTMSISYVTALPDVSQASENIIYILEKTVDTATVHTINLYDKANNKFVECSSIEASLQNIYTKEQIDTKLNDYALKTEALKTDDLTTTINDSSTNAEVPTALATKIELDKKIDKTQITTTIDSTSTDDTVASAKSVYDFVGSLNSITGEVEYAEFYLKDDYVMVNGEYVPFELKRGNINITDGKFELKANKTYSIIMTTRPTDLDEATAPYSFYSVELVNTNDLTLYPLIVTFHDFKGGRGEVPTSSTTITPSSNIIVGSRISNTFGDYTTLMKNQTKIVVTEIPTPTSIMNVTNDHIKSVVSEDLDKKFDKTNVTTSFSSSSTDEQVFSAKTIYNILNAKLSGATKTATDLDEALTPGYYQLAGSSTANNVYTNCWGIMHVITNNASPTESWFWIWQIVYDNTKNKIYYRRKVNTSSWGAWIEICMTKVGDKEATSFTFNFPSQLTISSQSNQYYIHNGTCFIDISIVISGSTSTVGWEDISTGVLPKPKYGFTETVQSVNGIKPSLGLNFMQDGKVLLYSETSLTGDTYYYLHTSYQVAEN